MLLLRLDHPAGVFACDNERLWIGQGEFRGDGDHHGRTIARDVENTAIYGCVRIPGGIHDPELVLGLARIVNGNAREDHESSLLSIAPEDLAGGLFKLAEADESPFDQVLVCGAEKGGGLFRRQWCFCLREHERENHDGGGRSPSGHRMEQNVFPSWNLRVNDRRAARKPDQVGLLEQSGGKARRHRFAALQYRLERQGCGQQLEFCVRRDA